MTTYRVSISHVIEVEQEYEVEAPSFKEAEGVAATLWVVYPTKAQRETYIATRCGAFNFKTVKIGDKA
jgi:hypothetical protein